MKEITSLINFRDMGGIQASDGRQIKANMLYRTARLLPKKKSERKFLDGLGAECIIDLRNPSETQRRPDYVPEGASYINAPVLIDYEDTGVVPRNVKKYVLYATKQEIEKATEDFENAYKFMPYARHAYSKLFACMNEGKRIIYHCTAGKDRTGVAAMIIQLALGCDTESVIAEYLKTNAYRARDNKKFNFLIKYFVRKKHLFNYFNMCSYAHERFIVSAMEAIYQKYPTIEAFLGAEYGITEQNLADWKRFYLE